MIEIPPDVVRAMQDHAFAAPPWRGVKPGERQVAATTGIQMHVAKVNLVCHLSAPVELR